MGIANFFKPAGRYEFLHQKGVEMDRIAERNEQMQEKHKKKREQEASKFLHLCIPFCDSVHFYIFLMKDFIAVLP